MRRVAANQDVSEAERTHFVYLQHDRVIARKGKTVQCEETPDARVTPLARGSDQHALKLDGRYLHRSQYIAYTELPASAHGNNKVENAEHDIHISVSGDDTCDRELVENMCNNFVKNHSRDGIGAGLFPLTSKMQADYLFTLIGIQAMDGRQVFHIIFTPKDRSDYGWKGDAYIDSTAYQPVLVHTAMSRKIPFVVRTMLGTSLPGLGFSVTYAPQQGDIWFPVSFGTEFRIKLLFFYNREIVMTAQNRNFEHTHTDSRIIADPPPASQP